MAASRQLTGVLPHAAHPTIVSPRVHGNVHQKTSAAQEEAEVSHYATGQGYKMKYPETGSLKTAPPAAPVEVGAGEQSIQASPIHLVTGSCSCRDHSRRHRHHSESTPWEGVGVGAPTEGHQLTCGCRSGEEGAASGWVVGLLWVPWKGEGVEELRR